MAERSQDWLKQAERDLENARWEQKGGFHEWACFVAQQAAEKAIKALYEKLGGEAWGHSLFNLLKGLEEKLEIPKEIMKAGKFLDRFYVPARYPNGWQAGIPADYYSEEDSKNAIDSAEKILRFCKSILAQ